MDANQELIPESLTPKGNLRKITVNPSWEYHKEKQKNVYQRLKLKKYMGGERSTWKQSSVI